MSERALETEAKQDSSSEHSNVFRLHADTLTVSTRERLELLNITELVAARVRSSGIRQGIVIVNSLHTTLALFINEYQPALLDDLRAFLEELVSRDRYYKHNDPNFSDCDRSNADAHLRATLLGHNLALPIRDSELALGTFQAVILAELDGPRDRSLQLQLLGTA